MATSGFFRCVFVGICRQHLAIARSIYSLFRTCKLLSGGLVFFAHHSCRDWFGSGFALAWGSLGSGLGFGWWATWWATLRLVHIRCALPPYRTLVGWVVGRQAHYASLSLASFTLRSGFSSFYWMGYLSTMTSDSLVLF